MSMKSTDDDITGFWCAEVPPPTVHLFYWNFQEVTRIAKAPKL